MSRAFIEKENNEYFTEVTSYYVVVNYASLPYLMALFSPLLKVEKYVSFETCAKIYKKSILIRTDQCELNLIVSTIKCIKNYVAR